VAFLIYYFLPHFPRVMTCWAACSPHRCAGTPRSMISATATGALALALLLMPLEVRRCRLNR